MTESLRILILEDNPSDAELVQFELQETGIEFTAKVVMTEDAYVQAIQDYCPDLILSDYDLPKYTGAQALAEARRRCPDTPFILVTGAVTEDRAIEILTQGAKDYVLKNRLEQRLVPAVKRALAEADELKALKKAEDELRAAHRTLEDKVKTRTAELEAEIETRKKTEEALRESESQERARAVELQAIIDAVPGIVFIAHDPECRKMTGSRATDEFLRLQPEANLSKSAPDTERPVTFRAMKNGEEVPSDELPVQKAAKGRIIRDYELDILFSDGAKRTIFGNASPVFDEHGNPRGAIGVFGDITLRKQAEEKLQDSEKRYRRLFEAAKDGILILDANTGKVDDVNPFLLKLLGYSYDDLCGKYIWELGVFKDIAASKEAFQTLQDNEYIRYDDLPLETRSGQSIAVEFVSNVYLVDHHKVIQCNIRDITEHKQVKDERNRVLNDLQRERDRLQALVNGISDEIWFADTNKQFTLLNPSALHEFGLNSHADAIDIQKFAASLEVYRPDGSARPVEEAPPLRALAGEVVKNQEEMIRTPATGELRYRQVSSNPVRDAGGQIIGSVSVVRDVTERKKMEDTLRVSEERFSKAFKNSPNAITITRISDGKIIEGNDSVFNLLGYDHDEVVGKTTFDLGIWADADERVKLTQGLATKGFIRNQEFTLLKKDRTPVIVDLSAALINIDNQQCFLTSFIDITKRKKTEEALKESEQKYRELVKYAPTGIYEIDFLNRRFVTVNDAMILLSGYSREELLAMDPLDILDEEGKNAFMARISRMLKGEKPDETVEYKVKAKDGHTIYAVLNVSFKVNEQGKPIGATVVGHDITERKKAEAIVQKALQRITALVSNIRSGILLVREKKIASANQAFCDYFELRNLPEDLIGLTPDEMIGKIKHVYLYPEQEVTRIQEIVERGEPVTGEEIAMHDGRTCLRDYVPMYAEGKYYAHLWNHTDITIRKQAEGALRLSEEKFATAFANNPAAIALSRLDDGLILDVNDTWVALNGYSREEAIGQSARKMRIWPTVESANRFVQELKKNDSLHGWVQEFRKKSGEFFMTQLSAQLLTVQGEKVILSTLVDITELKQIEESLKKRTQQLEDTNKELESFSYSVSHDLKAPLRAIEGYSRMLLKKDAETLSEDTRRKLDVICSNTEKMNILIDDLLSFSKVLKSDIAISEINMDKLAKEAWAEIQAANTERKLELKIKDMLPAKGDPALIRQVLFNLLSNAVKFTKTKTPGIIEVSCYSENGDVVYRIKDNGVGFNMAYYDKLFGVFQRLHSQEEYEGTGVGLAIVHRIINRHGGKVWGEGGVDKGATFFFTLPSSQE